MKSAEFKALSERAPEFRDRVAKLSSALQESMAPFDAFDVLANIWFSNYVTFPVENEEADPETYAVIEYASQLLAKRNRREGKDLGRRFIPVTSATSLGIPLNWTA